jgi:hypothetical protein
MCSGISHTSTREPHFSQDTWSSAARRLGVVVTFCTTSGEWETEKVSIFGLFWAKSICVVTVLEDSDFNIVSQTGAPPEHSIGKQFDNPLVLDCGFCAW